jgi:hypothetical protein
MALLKPGEMASRAASLKRSVTANREIVSVISTAAGRRGRRYYYIAAGIGCGIKELEEVCTTALSYAGACLLVYSLPLTISRAVTVVRLAVQEGYVCVGACEIDEYCQQVCHIPGA